MESPYVFWGKASKDDPSQYHPLLCHLLDSYSVAQSVWNNYLSFKVKEIIADKLGIGLEDAGRWVPFLVSLHDIGKACPGFQMKNAHRQQIMMDIGFDFYNALSDHRLLTAFLVKEIFSGSDYGIPKLDRRTKATFSNSLGGHHGSYVDSTALMNVSPRDVGAGRWNTERKAVIESLVEISGITMCDTPEVAEKSESIITVFLSGLSSVADWISSSTDFFPYYCSKYVPVGDYHKISEKRADHAIKHLNWESYDIIRERTFLEAFNGISRPFPLQAMVSDLSQELSQSGLVIIEAPMGEGKTEAALYLMETMNRETGRDGAFIALPTQATSNQMFTRMMNYFDERKDEHRINLALIHGQAMLSDDYQRLVVSQSLSEGLEGNLVANEWFNYKKRSLLSPYGVGTIDQALLGVLPVKHFFVRLFGLAGKVVILDEVHAYDVYMSTLLDLLLKWLSALGAKVILLSATLPSVRRRQLIGAFGNESSEPETVYPRITWCSEKGSKSISFQSAAQTDEHRPKRIDIRFIDDKDDALLGILTETISDGGRVAILRNTVNSAQETYRMIKEGLDQTEFQVELLHARYPFLDRKYKEESVIAKFGRKRIPNGGKHILVATQVIEQSLDIDFDMMVSDMAPIDLLIQRSGRVHRHDNKRPLKMKNPCLYIIKPQFDELGVPGFGPSEFVYSRYILLKSYLSIIESKSILIPADIERLVEEVYSESTVGPDVYRLEEEKSRWQSEVEKDRKEAEKKVITPPDYDLPWLATNVILKEDEPTAHRMLQALTRLTRPNVSLICLYNQGDRLSIDKTGEEWLNLDIVPDLAIVKRLLNNAISISDSKVVEYFNERIEVPQSWAKSSLLRNHRPIIFQWDGDNNNFIYTINNKLIILDEDLGLIVENGR
ncbi:MAG: CRISPR-associated helicase Cas3' [Candidatus Methanomethylophilaceae archaeon]|nr:CRISPR-associated helicase Cas3' [Candidatus Methanomethylophilaceae archaeon]